MRSVFNWSVKSPISQVVQPPLLQDICPKDVKDGYKIAILHGCHFPQPILMMADALEYLWADEYIQAWFLMMENRC